MIIIIMRTELVRYFISELSGDLVDYCSIVPITSLTIDFFSYLVVHTARRWKIAAQTQTTNMVTQSSVIYC